MSYEEAAAALTQAVQLQATGRYAEALAAYDRGLTFQPANPAALNNRGNVLRKLSRHEEALAAYDRAIALQPDFADAHNNRGNALGSLKRHEEAIASYDRAIALKPDFAPAHYNRGFAFQELNRPDEALAAYDKAIALDPNYTDAWWNKAFVTLLTGDFEKGWPLYEWRWKLEDVVAKQRHFQQPLWRGDFDINGKTILLYVEQGFGDTIHFCRYAKLVAARGAKVILEVQPQLKSLMASLEGVTQLITHGDPLPAFDCHCPLPNLPLVFKTDLNSIPADAPYLRASADATAHWANILGSSKVPRVGIVWAGNPNHKNDSSRSMKLQDLLPLIASNVELISLQKQMPPAEEALLAANPKIKNITPQLKDFSDTAAAIMALDLVIAVDTAVAHLAGALGKPAWLLLPYAPEWRWLLNRGDSPWYPTMRLFRQRQSGDWSDVVKTLGQELQTLAQRSQFCGWTAYRRVHRLLRHESNIKG